MTSPDSGASLADLPEYAPIPKSALGVAPNEQGYYVGRVERNLYWVTDGVYQAAFLTTADGVVLFDAPPSIGHNLQRAVDEIAAEDGVSNRVTHFVYSHHHHDHGGAASIFDRNVVRIGHEETRRLLLRDGDPGRPVPDVTFADTYTLEVGGERVELAWHGPNHSPDNIYIHFPGHDTLMFIDVVNAGWVPIYNVNLSEDVIGYMGAPAIALDYPWTHLISGHLGRLATRDDVALHQQYIADIEASSREALAAVNLVPFYMHYGENFWAGVKAHLDTVTERAAAPVIAKYTRRAGGCGHRRVHQDYHVPDHAVAAPRPGAQRAGPPVTDGRLDAGVLSDLPDDELIAQLTAIPGIGPWTVQGAMLIALGREDVVLPGDLALRKATRAAYGLDHVPTEQEVLDIAEKWRPYRSLATSYLFSAAFDASGPTRVSPPET